LIFFAIFVFLNSKVFSQEKQDPIVGTWVQNCFRSVTGTGMRYQKLIIRKSGEDYKVRYSFEKMEGVKVKENGKQRIMKTSIIEYSNIPLELK